MRRAALVIAILGAPATAVADDPASLFGFEQPEPEEMMVLDPCWEADPSVFLCPTTPGDEPDRAPALLHERLTSEALWDLGAGDGTWITGARRALGASTDPYAPAPAFAGASALENRWTIDGLPVDAVTDGAPELRVPLMFLRSIDVRTGGMPASARASTGAVIDGQLRGGEDEDGLEVGLWLGAGAPARDLRAVPDRYDALSLDRDPLRSVTALVTGANTIQALWRWHAWTFFGFGIDADDDGATRIARRLRDDDGDGRYDRNDDRTLATDTIEARDLGGNAFSVPYVIRFGGARGAHTATVTAIGTTTSDQRRSAVGTPGATRVDRTTGVIDLLATWTARWHATALRVSAGWHHARRAEAGADGVQIGTAFIPGVDDVPDDEVLAAACADEVSPGLAACPLATGYYVRGGAGALTGTTADRPTVAAELSRQVRAHGVHTIAIGATMEDARLRVHRRFSGGTIERRLTDEIVFTSRYVELGAGDDTCDGQPCTFLDSATRIYRTRAIAAYAEDSWKPIRGVTVQGGLRWESMEVGTAVRFRDQLAPRLAISADPTERGRSRLFVSWGRYFPLLPASLGTALIGDADLLTSLASGLGTTETVRPGDPLAIDDALAPAMVEEVIAGADVVIVDRLHAGFSYQARWLRRGLDDVDGTFTNPALLRRDSRDYLAWFGNAPTADVHVRVGWARSRQAGSWAGVYDPTEGTTLYQAAFDGQPNGLGRLPLDTPHRLFVEAVAHHPLSSSELTIGARFQIASGTPVGAVAGADGEVPLLPRGALSRTPTTSSVVLHVGLTRGALRLGLDVIDVFDRRAPVAVDQRWTTDDVRPIEGGDATDLLWLRTIDDDRARVNPSYGVATRYAPPVSARLSATFTY